MSGNPSLEDLEALVSSIGKPEPTVSVAADEPEQKPADNALRPFVSAVQLAKDVDFSLSNLDEAIREQASKFVYYANLAANARRQYERQKVLAEVTESQLYAHHREQLTAEGKKATEAQVDAAVKQDPRWYAAQQRTIDARAIFDIANDAREAFGQRKDMLIQVSVDRRKEREGELRINAATFDPATAQREMLKTLANQQKAAA